MGKKKRGITLDDLSPAHRAQALAQITSTVPAANGKPGVGNAPLGAKKAARHHRPYRGVCSIHYSCRRKRLADADGDFYKWFTDALVDTGILQDDKAEFVQEIIHRASVKAQGGEENMTMEVWIEQIEQEGA